MPDRDIAGHLTYPGDKTETVGQIIGVDQPYVIVTAEHDPATDTTRVAVAEAEFADFRAASGQPVS